MKSTRDPAQLYRAGIAEYHRAVYWRRGPVRISSRTGDPGAVRAAARGAHSVDLEIRVNGGSGVTRNLSSGGVYFETDDAVAPGQEVVLVFPFEHAAPPGTKARCSARVARVERRGSRYGVAAAYGTIAFETQ